MRNIQLFLRRCVRRFIREQRLPSKDLQQWRDELLTAILLVALVLGTIAAVPSAMMAIRDRLYPVVLIDALALAWLFFLWRSRALSFTARSWHFLFIVYALGVFFFFIIGPVSQIYLMGVPILASLLLGLRPAIFALLINSITLLLIGYYSNVDLQFAHFHDKPFLRWIIIVINFTLISGVITVTCSVLLRRLEESLRKQILISTHLKTEQVSLRRANEELRLISAAVENLNDIVIITNNEKTKNGPNIVFVNHAFERTVGYSQSESKGLSTHFLFGPDTDPIEVAKIRDAIENQRSVKGELLAYTKSAEKFWLEYDVQAMFEYDEQPNCQHTRVCTHFVTVGRDVSARKKAETEIYRLAFLDVLTGLPNRRLLLDRMNLLLLNSRQHGHTCAAMFIDLDHFKKINDARGHAIGDLVLIEMARRFSSMLREVDTIARIGGDEFVVLIDRLDQDIVLAEKTAFSIAEKIRGAVTREFELEGQMYSSSCSIGVTLMPRSGQTVDDILRESDTAMYKAKAAGRNQIIFFESAMRAEVEQRLSLEQDLAKALELGELKMAMQAQVDNCGVTIGAELLMRWNNEVRGMVSPVVFIPLAEESGLIVQFGDWVVNQACLIVKKLRYHEHDFPISINLSPKQFRQKDFVEKIQASLRTHEINGADLIFEVTEGLFIDNLPETISKMLALTEMGIRFSIDDFGTGYSSLNYLKRLPLYELKIDKSFVQDVPLDANDTAIVCAILSMARQFGLKVVAEGVETDDQAKFLIQSGCDSLQGFLYSRPVEPDVWMANQKKSDSGKLNSAKLS